jgi:hypothetical protein
MIVQSKRNFIIAVTYPLFGLLNQARWRKLLSQETY